MKIETKEEVEHIAKIIEAMQKAYINQTIGESIRLLKALDFVQRAANSFNNPQPPVAPQTENNKILPMRGKKK